MKKNCKSCGPSGGGEDGPGKPMLYVLAAITVPSLIVAGAQLVGTQGARISDARCAWDASKQRYVAEVTIRNQEDAAKVVSFYVQGRFRPPQGGRWPDERTKVQFESTRQYGAVPLQPREARRGQVEFVIPGAREFLCSATGTVDQQEPTSF